MRASMRLHACACKDCKGGLANSCTRTITPAQVAVYATLLPLLLQQQLPACSSAVTKFLESTAASPAVVQAREQVRMRRAWPAEEVSSGPYRRALCTPPAQPPALVPTNPSTRVDCLPFSCPPTQLLAAAEPSQGQQQPGAASTAPLLAAFAEDVARADAARPRLPIHGQRNILVRTRAARKTSTEGQRAQSGMGGPSSLQPAPASLRSSLLAPPSCSP